MLLRPPLFACVLALPITGCVTALPPAGSPEGRAIARMPPLPPSAPATKAAPRPAVAPMPSPVQAVAPAPRPGPTPAVVVAAMPAPVPAPALEPMASPAPAVAPPPPPDSTPTGTKSADSAAILASAPPGAWRRLRTEDTVYLETPAGPVVIELFPAFAPAHVARVKALVRAGQFRHQKIVRVQDNYVVQWGDGEHVPAFAHAALPDEWSVSPFPAGVAFTRLPDGDVYAPVVGHADGIPVARDPAGRGGDEAWPAHCYGMVGVGRGEPPDNGNGAELYVVTGHAPRHLDRNVILIGRVVAGIDKLSSLPRGTGALGFYTAEEQKVPLTGEGMRMAGDVPPAERTPLEVLRTDTPTWAAFVAAKRHRAGGWYATPVDRVELCNVPLPARAAAPAPTPAPTPAR